MQKRPSRSAPQFFRVHRAFAVFVRSLEREIDEIEIFILGQGLVIVGIGDGPILFEMRPPSSPGSRVPS